MAKVPRSHEPVAVRESSRTQPTKECLVPSKAMARQRLACIFPLSARAEPIVSNFHSDWVEVSSATGESYSQARFGRKLPLLSLAL